MDNVKFQLTEKVDIKDHRISGVVNGIYFSRSGEVKYEIEYVANGEIKSRWFSHSELCSAM